MKPLITFALIAYNQERFIAEAVQGALNQTYTPLEIILSDDYSTDNTYEIIKNIANRYTGSHHIVVRQNKKNMGIGSHINQIMEVAKGELIVIAAGDDVSLPTRTAIVWQEYLNSGCKAYSLFSNEYLMDETGNVRVIGRKNPPDPKTITLDWFMQHQSSVTGSSHAWHRDVFDKFGPLDDGVISEDAAIPFRSLLLGCIRYIHEPLVLRRITGKNLSMTSFQVDPGISGKEYQKYLHSHAANFIAVYLTRINDINQLIRLRPDQVNELEFLKNLCEKKLIRTRLELKFWESPRTKKITLIFKDFIGNGYNKTALRLYLSWLIPQVYMRLVHYISNKQRVLLP